MLNRTALPWIVGSSAALLLGVAAASAEIVQQPVTHTHGDATLTGILVYDDAKVSPDKKAPGVLVIHEWWGLNDYAVKRARMLAELGYVAFAADIYGLGGPDKATADPAEAGQRAGPFMQDRGLYRARAAACLEALADQPQTDKTRLAAIGYCFGGTGVLELAASGADVDGVVAFHGGLGIDFPTEPGAVKASILVCHGTPDPFVPEGEPARFMAKLEAIKADYQFISYDTALHAFTNPEADKVAAMGLGGVGYDAQADARSWAHMRLFFEQIFAPQP